MIFKEVVNYILIVLSILLMVAIFNKSEARVITCEYMFGERNIEIKVPKDKKPKKIVNKQEKNTIIVYINNYDNLNEMVNYVNISDGKYNVTYPLNCQ